MTTFVLTCQKKISDFLYFFKFRSSSLSFTINFEGFQKDCEAIFLTNKLFVFSMNTLSLICFLTYNWKHSSFGICFQVLKASQTFTPVISCKKLSFQFYFNSAILSNLKLIQKVRLSTPYEDQNTKILQKIRIFPILCVPALAFESRIFH